MAEGANLVRIGRFEVRYFDAAFLFVCFISFYLQVFSLPAHPIFFEADHVNLLNDVKRMTEGEVIYRDFFEFVFPGSHSLYFAFMSIFGPKYWIVSALTIAHGMASVILGLAISRRIIADNIYAYIPSAIYAFVGFRWFGLDGEHRFFSPIFALLAIFFLIEKRTYGRIVVAGVCCALSSFFTQQRGVLAVAAITVFLFVEVGLKKKDWIQFFRSSIALGSAFLLTLSLLLAPFVFAAGAERFFESTVLFLVSYAKDPTENSLQTYWLTFEKLRVQGYLITVVALIYHALVPAIYVVGFIFVWIKRNDSRTLHKSGVLLVALLGAMLAIGTTAPNTPRLFQVALPALIVFGWLIYNLAPSFETVGKASCICVDALWCISRIQNPNRLGFYYFSDTKRTACIYGSNIS